jgi:hypothetical protein
VEEPRHRFFRKSEYFGTKEGSVCPKVCVKLCGPISTGLVFGLGGIFITS